MSKRTIGLVMSMVVAIGGVAAPAVAVDPPKIRILNALAGMRIDVCIGGVQIAQNVRYKKVVVPNGLAAGAHKIKVTKGNKPGPCTTQKLINETVVLAEGDNVTFAVYKKRGQELLRRFDNDIVLPSGDMSSIVFRNVSTAHKADFWAWSQINQAAIGPTITVRRGKTSGTFDVPATWTIVTVVPSKRWPNRSILKNLKPGHVYELYAMGDSRRSFKLKLLEQDGVVL